MVRRLLVKRCYTGARHVLKFLSTKIKLVWFNLQLSQQLHFLQIRFISKCNVMSVLLNYRQFYEKLTFCLFIQSFFSFNGIC